MAEQICPHCDRQITQKDIDDYPRRLRERKLREEYRKSKVGRKNENKTMAPVLLCLLVSALTIAPHLFMDIEVVMSYTRVLLYAEVVFGVMAVVWLIYGLCIKLPGLENAYVSSKLQEN